tara:strand:+ start:230 stop:1624 length:1395 start_codon:yes stop_codon:yes gene_type:complete
MDTTLHEAKSPNPGDRSTVSYSIVELNQKYAEGSLSPTEAVASCLEAIDALNPTIEAWQAVYEEEAQEAAVLANAEFEAGRRRGPFHGVPFALKDIVDVEGKLTAAGCAEWRERRSKVTAEIAQRLIAAGGILIGKTKTVEFAFGGWGTNQRMGTPHNPWDAKVARTPGGSSSGSGAAVASGMIPCAIGTDTGGSVRLPAAFCGIVGLKTTEGLLPTDGIVPLSHTLDTPGPMARSVTDVALMYEALCSNPVNLDLSVEITGTRIGSLSDEERIGIEAEQLDAYDRALSQLADLGAEIIQFQPAKPFEEMKEAAAIILTAEGYFHHGALMDDPDSLVDENVRPRFKAGADISSAQYVGALLQRDRDRESFALAAQDIDALVTPTTPMLPPPLAETDELSTPARFTRAINYLSMCGTSVPSGISNQGLPTSLQIACAGGKEAVCLQISAAYERARGDLPAPPLFA